MFLSWLVLLATTFLMEWLWWYTILALALALALAVGSDILRWEIVLNFGVGNAIDCHEHAIAITRVYSSMDVYVCLDVNSKR